MVSAYANWSPKSFYITGRECFKGWKSTTRHRSDRSCTNACKYAHKKCPEVCICATGFYKGKAHRRGLKRYLD
jgi:hypothetical protein